MARIRSIKPEFSTDGNNLALSDSCALFFILLWTYCDDEGKHRLDLRQLVAELGGRWHQGKVKLFVSCLLKSGQLRINSDSTWIQVRGWSHQKIDKPKQPQVKASELQWVERSNSTNDLEWSRLIDARIGSDRRDRIGSDQVSKPENSPKPKKPKPTKPNPPEAKSPVPIPEPETDHAKALRDAIRSSYRTAFSRRYGIEKENFNQLENAQISKFAQRIGSDAPAVVEFYLTHNDQFYLKQSHSIGAMLANAEALQTQWKTNAAITTHQAREMERGASSTISDAEMESLLGFKDEPRIVAPIQNEMRLLKFGGKND